MTEVKILFCIILDAGQTRDDSETQGPIRLWSAVPPGSAPISPQEARFSLGVKFRKPVPVQQWALTITHTCITL